MSGCPLKVVLSLLKNLLYDHIICSTFSFAPDHVNMVSRFMEHNLLLFVTQFLLEELILPSYLSLNGYLAIRNHLLI
jgi:hypothetical protein